MHGRSFWMGAWHLCGAGGGVSFPYLVHIILNSLNSVDSLVPIPSHPQFHSLLDYKTKEPA